jgi:Ca2+-binding EF-hand superfamily protein
MRNAFTLTAFAVVACLNGAAIQAADDGPIQASGAPAIQDAPWFKKADKDGDGKLSRAEHWNAELFSKVDTDQDGFATAAELQDYYAKNPTPKKKRPGGAKKAASKAAQPADAKPTQAAANLKGETATTDAQPSKQAAQPAKSNVAPTPDAKTQRRLEENFTKLDVNADGKLTRAEHDAIKVSQKFFREHPEAVEPRFTRLDADGNGILSLDEYLRRKTVEPDSLKKDGQPANATTPPAPSATSQGAATTGVVDIAFFEKNIRPLLISKCYECHSADTKEPKGGLTLDTREGMRLGGESGPAVVPGDVAASLLASAVRHKDGLEMPPKEKLTEQQIATVVRWIEMGAPDPRDGVVTTPKKRELTKDRGRTKDRDFVVRSLLQNHCITCHGPKVQKAKLRLDELQPDLRDKRSMATWTKVYDKLVAGEMPPKYRERPAQDELQAATMWLKKELHAVSLEQQQKTGRVLIRRLNGTEYENTMRDLLGTPVNLKGMLPDDNTVAGFDNIGAALDVSATHQRLYQDLADQAIAAVIPTRPPIPFSDMRTGKEIAMGFPKFLGKPMLKDDAIILYGKAGRLAYCRSAPVPRKGRYKVQLSIAAVGAENKPVPVAFMDVTERDFAVFRDLRDIPPGKPAVVETEIDLEPSHAFVVDLLTPREPKTGRGVMVEWLKIEGPVDPWPPTGYQRLFAGVPLKPRSVAEAEAEGKTPPEIPARRSESEWAADPLVPASAHPMEDAERLIRDFLPRAFRRPVSEELLQQYVARVHDKLDKGYAFQEAMTYAYKAILSSPHFLLLLEPGAVPALVKDDFQSTKLDDYALAARLSYFLWSTSPDQELLDLAANRELAKPAVLRSQVERMLASPKSHQFTANFVGQWLDLRKIDATVPDPRLYPDFDPILLWAMPRETYGFFEEVLKHDRSLLEFVDSDWTIVNERLAKLYGIPGVIGNELRKVTLPPGLHRGGVMTHASVLKVTADGMGTSPVLRGKWALEQIIGKPPAPPPRDVPAIEPDIRGATTIRQQLDKHRTIAACAQCHVHIDPPGFALESFDAIGGWRDYYRVSVPTSRGKVDLPGFTARQPVYRGPDVENGGETHDGRKFKNIDDYKQLLLADKDQLARNLTQKLLVYSTGADMQFADREPVEQIVARLATKNYGFRTLVHEIVQSRAFLNK